MKKTTLLFAVLSFAVSISAQSDTTILLVPCKTGMLVIDGIEKGTVEADDVRREKLSFGDHYIQLKTADKKYNTTVKLPGLPSGIVRLGCEETALVAGRIKLLDKKLTLVGILNQTLEKNTIGLDTGDDLIINCHLTNNKGTANISITRQETGTEIYKKESFPSLNDEHVRIPQKGIYVITLSTNALLAREAQIVLERQPALSSDPNFKTTVGWVIDTSFVELQTTNTRVFSQTAPGRINRTLVNVNLPANTAYWAYWIGVDQAATEQMQRFTENLGSVGKVIGKNPLVQLGFGLIKEIPMFSTTSTVNYHIADAINAQQFLAGQQYSYYRFKYANNVSSDYALVSDPARDVTFCFDNQSMASGHDVELRVVAFIINKKLAIEK